MADPQADKPIYINALNAEATAFDVALDMGYRLRQDEVPDPSVRVVMSWEHAKLLVIALQRLIDDFETKVAEIPLVAAVPPVTELNHGEREGT